MLRSISLSAVRAFEAAACAPTWRQRLEALAVGVPLVFLALLVGPAQDYVEDQSFIETPALSWPGSIRAAAMLAGIGLMLAISVPKLLRQGWRETALVAVVLGLLAATLWMAAPALTAIGNWNLLFFFVALAARREE